MPTPDITLRTGTPADHEAILDVHRRAFGSETEPALAARIMASDLTRPEWSVVAVDANDRPVGHVLISLSDLVLDTERRPVAVLSPLAVLPERQRNGIGGALVQEAISRTGEAGEPMLIVEGDWKYYTRFGFEQASTLGIERPHADIPIRAFMVYRLPGFPEGLSGRVVYSPAFDGV